MLMPSVLCSSSSICLVRAQQRADLRCSECLEIGLDDSGHTVSLEKGRKELRWGLCAGGLFEVSDNLDGLVHLGACDSASFLVGRVEAIEGLDVSCNRSVLGRGGVEGNAMVNLDGVDAGLLDASELSL